jgi:hypothetical protein
MRRFSLRLAIFLATFSFSYLSDAQDLTKSTLKQTSKDVHTWQDYLISDDAVVCGDKMQESYSVPSKLVWLYEELIGMQDRQSQPEYSERSFSVHLADTFKVYPHPSEIKFSNFKEPFTVQGKITYAGVVAKGYRHDFLRDEDGSLRLTIKIHFKTSAEKDWQLFSSLLKNAESIWANAFNSRWKKADRDFNLRFSFVPTRDKKQAHYSVNVKDETRGPYDTNWSRSWSSYTVAHEIGHMFGLGDEYNLINSKSECLGHFIMCTSRGSIQRMHLYFVLRRLIAQD